MRMPIGLVALIAVGMAVSSRADSAPPATGAELAQLCVRDADACQTFLSRVAAGFADDKTICLPHGVLPEHLRDSYKEWAAASDAELLAREPAEEAVTSALKEMFPCDE